MQPHVCSTLLHVAVLLTKTMACTVLSGLVECVSVGVCETESIKSYSHNRSICSQTIKSVDTCTMGLWKLRLGEKEIEVLLDGAAPYLVLAEKCLRALCCKVSSIFISQGFASLVYAYIFRCMSYMYMGW